MKRTRIRTQIIKVGSMRILVENHDDEPALFHDEIEIGRRLAAHPAKVAEILEVLLTDGFIGTFDEAVTTAELLLEVPSAT